MVLEGRAAIVTGAGSGIGHAIAQCFAENGAAVLVNYSRRAEESEDLARELTAAGHKAIPFKADVSDRSQAQSMVEAAVQEFGRLDILVNNAGVEMDVPFLEVTEEQWNTVLNVNLKGAFLCMQAAAQVMKDHGGGAIINVSSVHEDLPFPGFTPYAASKGGLRMLMRNAALELAHYGIRVNNIAPGAIATPINTRTLNDPRKLQTLARVIPLGRMGTPQEVAEVALYLASDRSSYVTGSTYYVDGGMVRYAQAV